MLPFRLPFGGGARMNPQQQDTSKSAEVMFHPSNYEDDVDLSQALAITHEQVNDVYMAGTSDGFTLLENGAVRKNPANGQQAPGGTHQ